MMSPLIPAALVAVGLYVAALLYFQCTVRRCKSKRDLRGRTVIVTGSNTGIGLETARDLAARNARVILACRSMSRGEKAARDIMNTTSNRNVIVKQVDISSFESVRAFAKDIQETEERLDILVNNAGVLLNGGKRKSVDGLELTMATNQFGPFLLTKLLLPLLKKSAPSRIVVVSSLGHKLVKMDFDRLKGGRSNYNAYELYWLSKLANVYFTLKLDEQLKGTGVTVNALHPGVVLTEIGRSTSFLVRIILIHLVKPFMKTAQDGAQTSIYVAVAEELDGVSGKYFSDCKEEKLKNHALDQGAVDKLWQWSEKVTKCDY